ncbi:hypothetical protein [Chryseobacterium lathyri]|uniref:hypothetical protein n=1 Tax=Chryseobacterium lathyri TaxID=395933 RepID=UPI001CC1524C|nr:hypothetical protein [Chryseobacterium lathyri]
MKKLLLLFLVPYGIFAQVGINTSTPSATFEVAAKEATGTITTVDGMLIPRINRQRAQSMTGIPTSALIYVNDISTGTQTGNAVNIDNTGFYFFNGTTWTKLNANIYSSDGALTGNRTVTQADHTLAFNGTSTNAFSVNGATFSVDAANNRVGIGTSTPTAKMEIESGVDGSSGLKFTNMNNTTTPSSNTSPLGIDANGNVVVQSSITTSFRSFNINATTPTSSSVAIGSLEFRYPSTTCTNTDSYMQVRTTTGTNNTGIIHGISRTAQNGSGFINSVPLTITPAFANIGAGIPSNPNPALIPINCTQDGHAEFTFFSYVDKTFYRVSFHIADGDGLGFGALGYIFVEFQR